MIQHGWKTKNYRRDVEKVQLEGAVDTGCQGHSQVSRSYFPECGESIGITEDASRNVTLQGPSPEGW